VFRLVGAASRTCGCFGDRVNGVPVLGWRVGFRTPVAVGDAAGLMSFAPAGRPGAVRGRVPCQVHLFSRPSGHRGFTSERKPALSRRSSREGVDLGFCSARTFGGRVDRLFGGPGCRSNFLTDEQAAGQAAFRGVPHRSELERFFFPCNADRELMPSPATGGSPRPCTPCAWSANRATAGRSRRRPACKRAATPWPGRSSEAGPYSSARTVTTPWRTRSARSAWSSAHWLREPDVARLSRSCATT
jgi:hypothetical protein